MSQLYNQIHDPSNFIHPTAIIEADVKIGKNNYFGPYCYIKNGTTIADDNIFEAFVSVNTPDEHRDYFDGSSKFGVIIGHNNIFREYVTINGGTNRNTQVDNNVTMLRGSHLGHDCIVEDKVTLSCNVLVGGESYIMEGVNCGLGAIIHQYSVLGSFSMLGMGTIITKSSVIKPGEIHIGSPARFLHLNKIGLERNKITGEQLFDEETRYFNLCKKQI